MRRKLTDFARAQVPHTAPDWTTAHTVVLVILVALVLLVVLTGDAVADIASIPVASQVWLLRLFMTIGGLAMLNLLVVRDLPSTRFIGYTLIAVGILLTVARNDWQTGAPLTLGVAVMFGGLLVEMLGITLRPTLTEQNRMLKRDLAAARDALNAREADVYRWSVIAEAQAKKLREHGLPTNLPEDHP
ncbi:hypothetical protein [Deinococcus pimensis]|uniref:hypothetical protein n=1 Tax=Deinococcus pimensis TaxID=309888 RepID=UPI00048307B3|nr:hypothetical protein [Deinococcus pimensis]